MEKDFSSTETDAIWQAEFMCEKYHEKMNTMVTAIKTIAVVSYVFPLFKTNANMCSSISKIFFLYEIFC